MITVQDIQVFIDKLAPRHLAEDWDNVGLLLGDARREVRRIMTCLTVTPESASEAVEEGANLIVAHHPLPFRPLNRITSETLAGRLVLQLIESRVALISPHTCFDSAALGINQMLAEGIGLREIQPLVAAHDAADGIGAGRFGRYDVPQTLAAIAQRLGEFLGVRRYHRVGDADAMISQVAVACGSAGEFLDDARQAGCELLLTGETNFHTCLASAAEGVHLLLPGHFASERFAVEQLAARLQTHFPNQVTWASRQEQDPVSWDEIA